MITKSYAKNGKTCRVTFKIPKGSGAQMASLCGSFNDWDPSAHPMKALKDGSFSAAVSLKAGEQYAFRYWLDGARWVNDEGADGYAPTEFGSENSVIEL
jgi:1,4-alpha-glucan branching enzyme